MKLRFKLIILASFSILILAGIASLYSNQALAQTCQNPTPPNDAPTVTLRPDGHTVDISYDYVTNTTQTYLNFQRTTQLGFRNNGTEIATQFGNYGTVFDRPAGDTQYYYQLQTTSGSNTTYSNTIGIKTPADINTSCSRTIGSAFTPPQVYFCFSS